jgi:uncharacterized protein involved in exopolysaccharide biosynthesis
MEDSQYSFNSSDLLVKIYNYRKVLITVSVLAAIISSIVALLMQPQYKASVIMFPAPGDAISKALISTYNASVESGVYGQDEDVERILQTLNSGELKNKLVERHNLYEHYDIDTTEKQYRSKLADKYVKNFKFSRTPYMAVEVDVYDHDPVFAAKLANEMPALLDEVMSEMEKRRARIAYEIVKAEYDAKEKLMAEKNNELRTIMKKGVYDFESQSEVLNKAYVDAIAKGNTRVENQLKEQLEVLGEYGGQYLSIREFMEHENENLAHLSGRLKEAKVDAEQSLSHAFILNKAEVPDRKAKPRRTIIVITATITSFVMCFVLLLLFESFQQIRKQSKQ